MILGSVLKLLLLICFQPIDSKQQQQQNSRYLDKIIDIIQSSPLIPYQQVSCRCYWYVAYCVVN